MLSTYIKFGLNSLMSGTCCSIVFHHIGFLGLMIRLYSIQLDIGIR